MANVKIRRVTCPWGLLGAIGLALVIEGSLAHRKLDFLRPENADWMLSRRTARREAPGCDILCLGSSMVQGGVFPRVIQERTGRKVLNLAVCGGHAPGAYYVLCQALRAGARPSAVIVDFHPAFLQSSYRVSGECWPYLLGARDALDMAWAVGDPSFFATTVLAAHVPSLRHRYRIRDRVLGALRGESTSLREVNEAHLRNMVRNRGALIGSRNAAYRGEVSPVYESIFLTERWSCNPQNFAYIHRFLSLCADRGIRVYWLLLPLAPALQARREAVGADRAYEQFVARWQVRYKNVTVVDGRHSGYDPPVFMDASHLDPQGAFVLSDDLAGLLSAPSRPDGNWVRLPRYRDLPMDVAVEGMPISIAATRGKPGVRH